MNNVLCWTKVRRVIQMMMSWQMNVHWLLKNRVQRKNNGGALWFGNDRLDKITSLQAWQWFQTSVLAIVKKNVRTTYPMHNPPILSHPPKKVPDTLSASLWRGRGNDEYPQRAMEVTADQRDCQRPQGRVGWSQCVWTPTLIKIKKICHCVSGVSGR